MFAPTLTIDVGAVIANWSRLAARHAGETAAVLKADAYGLGAALIGPALAQSGCRRFFVATADEGAALRSVLPTAWIAVLNGCPPGAERDFAGHSLIPALNSLADAIRWSDAAHKSDRPFPALLHVDTGMNRLGVDRADLARLVTEPERIAGASLQYVMSHLISAERPEAAETAIQAKRFATVAASFPKLKTSFANSAGLFLGPDFVSDLARPGIALYGGNPTPGSANPMRPVVHLAAPIVQVRAIEAGETVGYDASWQAMRPSRIATIAVGYADGMPRALAGRLVARHQGRGIRSVGRISMDLMTFDVTDYPDISVGDAIELIGPNHGIDDIATEAGTIGYEILTSLGRRYRRVAKSV